MARAKSKRNRSAIYLIMLAVGVFLSTLVVQGINLRANCQKLAVEQEELVEKKKSLKKERRQIKEQKAYTKTDEYIEKIAREKFGLVYDNEIIFKMEE